MTKNPSDYVVFLYYTAATGICLSHGSAVCRGHPSVCEPHDIYEQHALRLLGKAALAMMLLTNRRCLLLLLLFQVLYKSQLPLVCAFNKTDVVGCDFALEWMTDFEAFQEVFNPAKTCFKPHLHDTIFSF